MHTFTTLDEYIIQQQKDFPFATGELSRLLRDIGYAAKVIHREVNKAGLVDILGSTGKVNVQDEDVKKLDEYANDILIKCLQISGECAGIASEELNGFISFSNPIAKQSHYIVCMDPLDGSSNIDVNAPIGTIFSIYRRVSDVSSSCVINDFLQRGNAQIAAGYIIYGSSTMLVYTAGKGVNGFTLDVSLGEFCLSHPYLQIPSQGNIYSINQGNYNSFPIFCKKYIDWCMQSDKSEKRPYSLRYIGSLIADFHRNLIQGGIYIYPSTDSAPNGKLRMLFECNPMSMICEQAGGLAYDEHKNRILDIEMTDLHQRSTFYVGSKDMIEKAYSFI